MIFNKLRIFGVIFACVFTLPGFAADRDYYIITLNKNGGTGGLDKIYVKDGNSYNPTGSFTDADKIFIWDADEEKCKGKIDIPTKPGYTFMGYGDNDEAWINSSGGGDCRKIGELSGDETWSASWKECGSGYCSTDTNTCKKCSGGRYCEESKHFYCEKYNENIPDSSVAPLCQEYETSSSDGKSCYSWQYHYTITLYKNGGTGGLDKIYAVSEVDDYGHYDGAASLSKLFYYENIISSDSKITVPTKAGYTFNGYYYTASNGNNVTVIDKDGICNRDFDYKIEGTSSKQTWFADWKECESGVSYKNNCVSYTGCSAGKCKNDENECETCLAGHYCSESKFCKAYTSLVNDDNVAPLCPANTYSDGGNCTSCGIGYTTGNSGPIVTDSEDNVSGDGLCLKIDNDSGLGYGCISSRACQMVTPHLCHGGCSCGETKINDVLSDENTKPADLINCGFELVNYAISVSYLSQLLNNCRAAKSDSECNGNDCKQCKKGVNNILKNKKVARCLCNTSFGLGDNLTTVKTYSDVVDVVYPDDSASD